MAFCLFVRSVSPCLFGNSLSLNYLFLLPLSVPRSPAYISCLPIDHSDLYYANYSNRFPHSLQVSHNRSFHVFCILNNMYMNRDCI